MTRTFVSAVVLAPSSLIAAAQAPSMQWVDSYLAAAFPPKDTLCAMTTKAARLLGVDKERRAIKPQMAADIIAMSGNRPDDVSTLKHISFVMKDGHIVKQ